MLPLQMKAVDTRIHSPHPTPTAHTGVPRLVVSDSTEFWLFQRIQCGIHTFFKLYTLACACTRTHTHVHPLDQSRPVLIKGCAGRWRTKGTSSPLRTPSNCSSAPSRSGACLYLQKEAHSSGATSATAFTVQGTTCSHLVTFVTFGVFA